MLTVSVVTSITHRYSPVLLFLFLIWQIAGSNLGPEAVCRISSPSQVFLSPDFSVHFHCRCRELFLYLMIHKVAHTVGRTPLDEGLARRTCTPQTKHKIRTLVDLQLDARNSYLFTYNILIVIL